MRNTVKILFGLSMPVLALAAVWLWTFNKAKASKNNAKHIRPQLDDEQQLTSEDANEKAELTETCNDNVCSGIERLDKCGSLSGSVSSLKECLSDKSSNGSTNESASDEQLYQASQVEQVVQGQDEVTWEIEFPQALCGRLIGKKGKNVQKISQATGTKIRLIPQKDNAEASLRLVSLTGTPQQLSLALHALQEKFPSVPFKRLNGTTASVIEPTVQTTRIVLPDQGMFQVFVTNIVDANHFYVQLHDQMQTTHMMLQQLDQQMYQCYGACQSPVGTQAVATGMVYAAYSQCGWWRRAQVVGLLMNPEEVEITWLDYGGKEIVAVGTLRQLRQEFLQLPFQAVECYLSNVVPYPGESSFSMTACALFEGLTQNCILSARITGYNRDCPCLELYVPHCQWTGQPILINRELVRRGYARWSET